jgi:hypothetical protein
MLNYNFWGVLSTLVLLVVGNLAADPSAGSISTSSDYNFFDREYIPLSTPATFDEGIELAQSAIAGTGHTITEATNFFDQVTSFGSWLSLDQGRGLLGLSGGMPLRNRLLAMRNDQLNLRKYSGVRIGIFILDDLTIGAGGMYSDYSGLLPRGGGGTKFKSALVDQDPWAAMVWARMSLTTYVTNTFALTIRPSGFWLPLEGKFGYSAFNGFLGLGNAQLMPQAIFELAYKTDLWRSWQFSFHDYFMGVMERRSVLDEGILLGANLRDMSSYDTAGRYAFGGFAPPMNGTTANDSLSLNNNFFKGGSILFRNIGKATLSKSIGENTTASFFYMRQDGWDDQFNHFSAFNRIGAMLTQNGPLLTKYIGYNSIFSDESAPRSMAQWAYSGFRATLRPNLTAWASVGYLWTHGGVSDRNSTLWRAAIEHNIGPKTTHGISVGKTVTDPDFGAIYVGDFARYFITHELSSRVSLRLMAQHFKGERLDVGSDNEYKSNVLGGLISCNLGEQDTLVLFNAYEEFSSWGMQGWELLNHRLSYFHQFTPDLEGQLFYQYQHGDTAFGTKAGDFKEHLLFLGMAKRF